MPEQSRRGCGGGCAAQILMAVSLGASIVWLWEFGWWASALGLILFPITTFVAPFFAVAYGNWNPMIFLIGAVVVPVVELVYIAATKNHPDDAVK